ncbi:hypothetical protein D9613_006352 [Agrocybe pediades]|uniref:Uncharacterized protein n=1 Tax=Agrocybe pediades TaxID=84607 RepID=A0A8H4QV42_9AGAR|nr:hypothetical protein D9613_006352 [Agrocybe pediades]
MRRMMDSNIKTHIEVLNNDYNATSFQFRLVKTTRIKSKDWFGNVYPGSPQEQAMKLLYTVGDASTGRGNSNLTSTQWNSFNPTIVYRDHLHPAQHGYDRPRGGRDDGVGINTAGTLSQASGSEG